MLSFKAKNPVASSPHRQHHYVFYFWSPNCSLEPAYISWCNDYFRYKLVKPHSLDFIKSSQETGLAYRRTFCSTNSIWAKKSLYLSLVRSQLIYCSQIWRPSLLKDIITLETIQRRATKFILGDYTSSYESRLTKLPLLPLMMALELHNITFFINDGPRTVRHHLLIKNFKQPTLFFNILNFFSFNQNSTRSGTHCKLIQPITSTNRAKQFYFNRLPHALPPVDLSNSTDACYYSSGYTWANTKKLFRVCGQHTQKTHIAQLNSLSLAVPRVRTRTSKQE